MKDHSILLEIGAEGGSISLYKCFDDQNQDWYYFNTQEMAFDDLEMSGVNKNSKYCMSSAEALLKMQHQYQNVWDLYPLYVHEDLHELLIVFLEAHLKEEKPYFDFYTWSKVLSMTEVDLKGKLLQS